MEDIQKILSDYWGHEVFRPLQEDIIHSVLEGNDTLALLPTGGGKSICFQVPALAQEGICVVVSPLIALMKDQVGQLQQKNIPAIAIFSGMHRREIDMALDNCIYGKIKFLYLSPERLTTEIVKVRLQKMKVNLIAVDEAHCISQWGYDFRPPYLRIAEIRELLPKTPIIALTASATPSVVEDIQEKLQFKKNNALRKSFERKNLAYVVQHESNKSNRLLKIMHNLQGSGIIYARSRKKTQDIAAFINRQGIKADYYHAGLDPAIRDQKQKNWLTNRCRIIVATNAFGMGIDKPDVAFVVHLDIPESLEAYFQEAGRAGRDGQKAYAILLYDNTDILDLEAKTKRDFPEVETIRQTYQGLANYFRLAIGSGKDESYPFDLSDFSRQYKIPAIQVYNSLKFLEKEGYVSLSDALHLPSRVLILMKKDELYHFQIKNKTFDAYLQLLLRSYSGLFDEYVKIRETELARRANLPKRKLIEALEKLNELEVISYIPQTRLPQIVFLRERTDAKKLTISHEHYHDRMSAALARVKAVIKYVTAGQQCRSRMLLMYFGEKESARCGICDRCLERNKLPVTNLEFEQITEQIKDILLERPMLMHQLIPLIIGVKESETIKVIQWLIDNGKVREVGEQKLSWIR